MLSALAIAVPIAAVLGASVVLLPVAVWLLGRWALIFQAVELENTSALSALRRKLRRPGLGFDRAFAPPALGAAPGRRSLPGARPRRLELDATPPEGVDPAPAPGNVEECDQPNALGKSRIDDEIVAARLEPEHGSQQEQRSAGRPSLRATRRRVLDRILRDGSVVASECLRQAPLEELGRIQNPGRDSGGLLLEAVAPQTPGR